MNESGFFRQWNKFGGRHQSPFRMLPADQGFGRQDLAGAKINLRLKMQKEVTMVECLAQAGFQC
jgi:hypothetical protein